MSESSTDLPKKIEIAEFPTTVDGQQCWPNIPQMIIRIMIQKFTEILILKPIIRDYKKNTENERVY